ncbi:efflux transporter outer membrane subunit [Paraburkholderia sediminicola]|uniref:efflux transporter outer membrane subunit n=1 Tax=Paraburkholderia sediminicola TaxID=458836 RepID=UPI0038B7127F
MLTRLSRKLAVPAVLAGLVTIGGCASTGKIAPQDKIADSASLDVGSAIRDANSDAHWPNAHWWQAYNDPQLNQWIDMANQGSPSLSLTQARVREALSMAGVAHSALLPQVNGAMSIAREHWPDNMFYGPGPLANQNTWNNTGALSLEYHLDLWGKDKNSSERALDLAHASAADARAAQLELDTNIVRTYIGLSRDFALLDIAHATLSQQQQILALAQRRLAGGIGTQLDVSQAETPLPEYERQIESIQESIALEKNQLAALAGKGPGSGESIERPTLALDGPDGLPASLPFELVGHRPDIVAARWTVAAQARGIDVAKANFYPDINLMASLGGYAAAGPLFQFLKSANGSWTAGPAMSLPIFDGGRLRSELGAQSASFDEAVSQYNEAIVEALKDISDSLINLRSLQSQQNDTQRSVASATRSYNLAKEGFRRGLTDYVNVLIAQTQLLQAKQELAKIQAAQLEAHASLTEALGGGLDDPANGPKDSALAPSKHISPLGDLPLPGKSRTE